VVDEGLSAHRQQRGLFVLPVRLIHRYERSSTIITSNKSFGDWQELFGDPVIATAILDRLLHHCKVVNIKGHSYRCRVCIGLAIAKELPCGLCVTLCRRVWSGGILWIPRTTPSAFTPLVRPVPSKTLRGGTFLFSQKW